MSSKCTYCNKTVYHAEEQIHDGKKFHIQCFGKYKKEDLQRELAGRNITYQKQADVQPSYYRVGDPSTGATATMESGSQYRSNSGNTYSAPAPQASAPSGGAAPKFCPECGAPTNGGKFCGECGQKF